MDLELLVITAPTVSFCQWHLVYADGRVVGTETWNLFEEPERPEVKEVPF